VQQSLTLAAILKWVKHSVLRMITFFSRDVFSRHTQRAKAPVFEGGERVLTLRQTCCDTIPEQILKIRILKVGTLHYTASLKSIPRSVRNALLFPGALRPCALSLFFRGSPTLEVRQSLESCNRREKTYQRDDFVMIPSGGDKLLVCTVLTKPGEQPQLQNLHCRPPAFGLDSVLFVIITTPCRRTRIGLLGEPRCLDTKSFV